MKFGDSLRVQKDTGVQEIDFLTLVKSEITEKDGIDAVADDSQEGAEEETSEAKSEDENAAVQT